MSSFNCPFCTFLNGDLMPECAMCGAALACLARDSSLDAGDSPLDARDSPLDARDSSQTASGDPCSNCTFVNHPSMERCEMCGLSFEPPPVAFHLESKLYESKLYDSGLEHALAMMAVEEDAIVAARLAVAEEDRAIEAEMPKSDKYVRCPHCSRDIYIDEVACSIFICGATRTGKQLPQHNEAYAATTIANSAAWEYVGCGKQFQLVAGKPVACTGK